MKVLVLNDFREYSGGEKIFRTLARELIEMGHEVAALVGETIHMLDGVIEEFDPDVIHQHNFARFGPVALKYAAQYPFVQTVHDYWPICKNRGHFRQIEDRICDTLDQSFCGPCYHILMNIPMPVESRRLFEKIPMVAVSKHVADVIREWYPHVTYIHNGLSPEPDAHEATDERFVFCAAKPPDQLKGAHLFAAMAKGMPYRFVLAGGGQYPDVESTGLLTQRKLMGFYKRASIVVMPSIWEEPNGLPLQESMMYGKPMVVFNSGGMPEYAKNYVVPAQSVKDARELIDVLMKNPEQRKIAGEENRAWMNQHFTARVMATKYVALYESLAGKAGA